MKKKWIFLVLSPIFVWLLRLIISLIFWFISTLGIWDPLLLMAIKTFLNRILWILSIISIPLLIIWIVVLARNKDRKIQPIEVIQYSRQKSKKHMTRYLLWFLILFLLQILSSYIDWLNRLNPSILFNVASIVITLLSRRLTLWLAKISLSIVYDAKYNISDLFQWFYKTLKYIIAYIVSIIIIILWSILLIIPFTVPLINSIIGLIIILALSAFLIIAGVIILFRLSLSPYIILQDWLWTISALKKSWTMTKWFVWAMFTINIIAWLINMLWMIALFVWLLWTIPLYMIANAYIYKRILEEAWDKIIKKTIPKSALKIIAKTPKASIKKTPVKKTASKAVVKKVVVKKAK